MKYDQIQPESCFLYKTQELKGNVPNLTGAYLVQEWVGSTHPLDINVFFGN